MVRARSETMLVTRIDAGSRRRRPDELIVEEPMEIQLDGVVVSTTMRTPGHDYELAVGFCHTEGLLAGVPVVGVRYCATGSAVESEFNVVTVETAGRAPRATARLGTTSSSCGLCGSTALEQLTDRLSPLPDGLPRAPIEAFAGIADRALAGQGLFQSTGAVHAAAAFDLDGAPTIIREDVGRHNAVDKVIGRLLLDGALPAHRLGLFVSGRASFEIVQKAWAAGFSTVVAVSAPTALAVRTARQAEMMLVGFIRGAGLNIYSPER